MECYTGHIPAEQKEEFVKQIVHTKHIPGYMDFISTIKSENKYCESYYKETAKSLEDSFRKCNDILSYESNTSTSRDGYKEKSKISHTLRLHSHFCTIPGSIPRTIP